MTNKVDPNTIPDPPKDVTDDMVDELEEKRLSDDGSNWEIGE